MLFYNLIPKGAHAPFGTPPHFKGTLSFTTTSCQLSQRESQVLPARGCFYGEPLVSPTRWGGFIRPTPYPLPCTYLVKKDSRPAWEGDGFI